MARRLARSAYERPSETNPRRIAPADALLSFGVLAAAVWGGERGWGEKVEEGGERREVLWE